MPVPMPKSAPISQANAPKPSEPKSLGIANAIAESLPMAWLFGSVCAIGLVAFRYTQFRRWKSNLETVTDAQIRAQVQQIAREMRLKRGTTLLAAQKPIFCAMGYYRPAVIVPKNFSSFSLTQRECILRHELAHIAFGHISQLVLSLGVKCLFWWHPLTYVVCNQLSTAQELQCDETVAQGMGSGIPLAQSLEAIAIHHHNWRPVASATLFRRPSALVSRIARLSTMYKPLPRISRRKTMFATLASLISLTGICAFAQVQTYGNPFPAFRYLNWKEGNVWTYQITEDENGISTKTVTAWSQKESGKRDVFENTSSTQLQNLRPDGRAYPSYLAYEYYALDSRGLGEVHRNTLIQNLPGYEKQSTPGIILPNTFKKGDTWTWSEPWRGQVMVEPGKAAPVMPDVQYRGTVLEDDLPINLFGKERRAVVTEIGTDDRDYSYKRRFYFVADIGIVKIEYRDQKGKLYSTQTLTQFESGQGAIKDDAAMLAWVGAAHQLRGEALESLAILKTNETRDQYRSRFVSYRSEGKIRILRIWNKTISEFDFFNRANIEAFIRDENIAFSEDETQPFRNALGLHERLGRPFGQLYLFSIGAADGKIATSLIGGKDDSEITIQTPITRGTTKEILFLTLGANGVVQIKVEPQ